MRTTRSAKTWGGSAGSSANSSEFMIIVAKVSSSGSRRPVVWNVATTQTDLYRAVHSFHARHIGGRSHRFHQGSWAASFDSPSVHCDGYGMSRDLPRWTRRLCG